jgi:cyclic pyranopterin phosphate synthase
MPKEGIESVLHEDILTFEEIIRVVEAAAKIGIQKIKITGGEPLVRKGIVDLVKRIKNIQGIEQVTLTTNGVLLKDVAKELLEAGLDAINISLDTLNRIKYQRITRKDKLEEVLLGIEKAVALGIKVKINCVPMKEFNEADLVDIAAFAKNRKIDVRFIELMPIGLGKSFQLITYQDVKEKLEKVYGRSQSSDVVLGNGPAKYYNFKDFQGSIGFISAITNEFCEECNRIRMTAEGDLKLCLHYNKGIALRPLLRNDINKEELQKILEEAIYIKPRNHCFLQPSSNDLENKNMVQIGG